MKNVSALENIHKHGLFGNHDSKDELIKSIVIVIA